MNYRKITDAYYAKWLGLGTIPTLKAGEVKFVYSTERNCKQYGYSAVFEIGGSSISMKVRKEKLKKQD